MGSFQQCKRSDNKRCTVKVRWGIFIRNLTVFFILKSGCKYSHTNSSNFAMILTSQDDHLTAGARPHAVYVTFSLILKVRLVTVKKKKKKKRLSAASTLHDSTLHPSLNDHFWSFFFFFVTHVQFVVRATEINTPWSRSAILDCVRTKSRLDGHKV